MNIGDKVISLVNEMDVIEGGLYEVKRIGENGVYIKDEVGEGYFLRNGEFSDLEKSPSPIRTVTRREIVAGNYGIVAITKNNKVMIAAGNYTPDELREAAHTLNQIAEVLGDNGK